MHIVIIGLSITSSWGNGHATTYRALTRALAARGHKVTFFERDAPWYAEHRDLPSPPDTTTYLYDSLPDLQGAHGRTIRDADVVIVGSYVPDGIAVGDWVTAHASGVTAFYDIDTPVTLAAIGRGEAAYVSKELVSRYDIYLSFTGGPTLHRLERELGARRARPLYCAVDPDLYYPEPADPSWDLGYLGTFSHDRQPTLERLLIAPAQRLPSRGFVVAGAQFPEDMPWPANVTRLEHLAPRSHRTFYNAQRYTLNVTRADMIRAGWSPSVRLFEAAACGTPIISDSWDGLEAFFEPGVEILVARESADVVGWLRGQSERDRRAIGERARRRVLAHHSATHRAADLESYIAEVAGASAIR